MFDVSLVEARDLRHQLSLDEALLGISPDVHGVVPLPKPRTERRFSKPLNSPVLYL
jgi:hypothetical protein